MLMPVAGCAEESKPVTSDAAHNAIVIAHRGASGERPEHTIAAYELAIAQGADFIEPDLVPTSDGVLVARHENEISGTTDVAGRPEFAGRRTTKAIDGKQVTGWFTEDFTLAELKTLRAKERLPQLRPANTGYDGRFEVPTLAEVIALAQKHGVGIYPETKHPGYFASIGLPLEARLIEQLKAAGWTRRSDPVFIQSFEVDNLKALRKLTDLSLIQLIDKEGAPADRAVESYAAMRTPAGLKAIATYADGIGPNKDVVTAELVEAAHAAGLKVHPWTFRAENYFLPMRRWSGVNPRGRGDLPGEIAAYLDMGVDGIFSDFPGVAAQTVGKTHNQE
ncbi:glycerophosphodiester phosphodiesterase [Sphingomonas gilva]